MKYVVPALVTPMKRNPFFCFDPVQAVGMDWFFVVFRDFFLSSVFRRVRELLMFLGIIGQTGCLAVWLRASRSW